MGMNNFCGFKTAYLIEREEFSYIEDLMAENEDLFWKEMNELELPNGWTFTGTDISGAAGYVLTFDLSVYPKPAQMRALVRALAGLNEKYKKIAYDKATLFNSDELDDWSVYELTDEIIEEATKLWYWGGMTGDYGAIAEKLELTTCPAGDVPRWVNPMKEGSK